MAYILIPGFKGGKSAGLYESPDKQTYQTVKDLDVHSRNNLLKPRPVFTNVALPTISGGTSLKFHDQYIASNGRFYVLGSGTYGGFSTQFLWATDVLPSPNYILPNGSPTYYPVFQGTTSSIGTELEEFSGNLYFGYGTTLKKISTATMATTFTVSIASPAVFSCSTHGLTAGDGVMFATTSLLPTGLSPGVMYYVIAAGLTADEFEVSTTPGGSAVNTSGTQSGTHTIVMVSKTVSSSLGTLGTMCSNQLAGKIAFANGSSVGTYDGTTLSATALSLSSGDSVVDIEPYGKYFVIGIRTLGKPAKFLLWDGASNTVDDVIYTGDNGLQAFKMVGNEIRAVFSDSAEVRFYAFQIGSKPAPVITFPIAPEAGSRNGVVAIANIKNLTVFGLRGYAYNIDAMLYSYGSLLGADPDVFSPYRLVNSGATTAVGFKSLRDYAGQTIVIWENERDGVQHIEATGISTDASANGVYESSVFALNGGLGGTIKGIEIFHEALPASCGFTVQLKLYSNYPWDGSVPSADSYVDLVIPQGSGSTTGKTQSTTNSTYTQIKNSPYFKKARYAQIKILFNEVSGSNSPGIIYPIIIEVE